MAKNNKQGLPYVPVAVVKKKLGHLTYFIQIQDVLTWKRHVDHQKSLGHDVFVPEPADEVIFSSWFPKVPDTIDHNPAPNTEQQEPARRYPQCQSWLVHSRN